MNREPQRRAGRAFRARRPAATRRAAPDRRTPDRRAAPASVVRPSLALHDRRHGRRVSCAGPWARTAHGRTWRSAGSLRALYLLRGFYRFFGRRASVALLTPIVLYFFLTGRAARRASRDYLRHDLGDPEGRAALGRRPSLRHGVPPPARVRREPARPHDPVERRRREHLDRQPRPRAGRRAGARGARRDPAELAPGQLRHAAPAVGGDRHHA